MPPLIDFETALQLATEGVAPLTTTEMVDLAEASERVLAGAILADRDLPPFHRAAMDGYAYCNEHREASMPVCAHVRAGDTADVNVPPGSCIGIATGAPLPTMCDTVVPHELTDRGDPLCITEDPPATGANVHPRSADAKAGQILIGAGQRLSAAEIGIAAMAGHQSLTVRSRPSVAILTSGDEVVQAGKDPAPHQIRNSNHPMVATLVARSGGRCVLHRHLADEPGEVRAAIETAIGQADVLVTTGGISAGTHDFLASTLEQLGCRWRINGVAMKPGKPVRIGDLDGTAVVCLPGNPVSALVTGSLFLSPILRAMLSLTPGPRWRTVRLSEPLRSNTQRTLLRPAHLLDADTASVPSWQGSGDLAHLVGTSGLIRLPHMETAEAGIEVSFTRWP